MDLIRPRLLEWQWSDYALKHRNRTNLLLHVVAIPLFDVATIVLVADAMSRWVDGAALAVAAMVAAVVMEGHGRRFVVEQWVTFPRFVLSGGWFRHISHAR